jgi:hypothetical protein
MTPKSLLLGLSLEPGGDCDTLVGPTGILDTPLDLD